MQYINHLPDMAELTLPESVAQDFCRQLLEPFDSDASAMQFWREAPSTVIILDPSDSIEDLHRDSAWNSIEFALTYPEYTVPLAMGYLLSVAIVNDSGSGIYLVIPPELSHLISER
jgi:hypothetical protein